jgi:hypothetical protein
MTADTTIELHHLLKGPEDAPVLVLANSLGTSLNVWDEQVEALPSASPRSWSPALTTPLHHPSTGAHPQPAPGCATRDHPQARHLANIEQPEEVTQAMLAHLGPLTERQENL